MAKRNIRLLLVSIFLSIAAWRCHAQGPANSWCVTGFGVADADLQGFLDYACSTIVDCAPINPGGKCYAPNTMHDHGSFALNYYYRITGDCKAGLGLIVNDNPSYGDCHYL